MFSSFPPRYVFKLNLMMLLYKSRLKAATSIQWPNLALATELKFMQVLYWLLDYSGNIQ